MPRTTQRIKRKLASGRVKPIEFRISHLYPEHPRVSPRGPLPKQRLVFILVREGLAQGGGIVYQGGKGSAKTMCGAGVDIWAHQRWPGLLSVAGRETYAALLPSMWFEYEQMLSRVPTSLIKSVTKPNTTGMGWVEWQNGGRTLFISLSNPDPWESANIGFAWVDEAHRQNKEIVGDHLQSRIRQEHAPRTMLLTTNPAGKQWIWKMAHPSSADRQSKWFWLQSSMYENPALPPDYLRRMEEKYPPGTPGHRRWCLGQSSALEGSVFGEIFDSDPESRMHVIPDFPIPEDWDRGRGLDWGLDNPCVCVWGAKHDGAWYLYRTHSATNKSARWHAQEILELEGSENMRWTPADPEIFRKVHVREGSEVRYSIADEFNSEGCVWTPANNARHLGLQMLLELFSVNEEKIHPLTLKQGAPRIFILDTPDNQELIAGLEAVEYRSERKDLDAPDDVKKKNDHHYDAVRYLVAEAPELAFPEPHRYKKPRPRGSRRDYVGY